MATKYLSTEGAQRIVDHIKELEAEATTSKKGLMSAADKTKLDGVASGAEVNQNAFANVKVGNVTVAADSKTDTLTVAAGDNVTVTPDAGTDKITISAVDTTYQEATSSSAGLMSASDKAKLNAIESGAEKNDVTGVKGEAESSYRTGDVNITKSNIGLGNVENKSSATIRSEITSQDVTAALGFTPISTDTDTTYVLTQDSANGRKLNLNGSDGSKVSVTIPDSDTVYNEATTSTAGLMSASDKSKLDGVSTGAEANQNAFGNVKVGSTTIAADSKTDTLTLSAGSNVTLTPDASSDTVTIAAIDTKYNSATTTTAGLMSAEDKAKLDGIAEGATASDADTTYSISKTGSTVTLTGSDGSTTSFVDSDTTYSDATTSASGLMSASDKIKLNGVATGAEVNQNAFANVKVGSTTVAADSKTDTLTLEAGSNVTLTPDASNDKVTITATDTTYNAATQSTPGLMSAADKKKLDGIAEGATASTDTNTTYTLTQDASDGHKITLTPSTGSATTITIPDNNTTYSEATTSTSGLMSASDKTKLNGVATGAEVNQNAFANVKVGSTTVAADSKTDTLTLEAGSNVTLTPDATNDKVTIAATDTNTTYSISKSGNTVTLTGSDGTTSTYTDENTTYSNATTSTAGLMSADDKTKLNGIATGAEVNQNAFGNVKVGDVTVAADGKTDTLTLTAGSNVTLTGDASADSVTISATDTKYTGTSPISVSGTTISHGNSGVTAASKGDTSNQTPGFGGTFKVPSGTVNATGHLTAFADHTVTIPSTAATTSAAGLMSASDKTKLDGVATGAEVNQSAFSNVKVGNTTVAADSKTDTLELAAGSNVTLTPDATNDKITIAADNTNTTYSISKSGSTITLTGSDGSTSTVSDANTTYSAATTSANGLMSSTDKTKLDGIATGAEVNQNAFANVKVGSTTVAADGKTDTLELSAGSNITLTPDATNDKITIAATNTTYSAATTSANGLMSSTDKTKLDGIASGAEVNQNAFGNVKVNSTTIAADGKTDTLELVAGSNVTLTPDATNDKITIASTNTTYSAATASANGLMTSTDFKKINPQAIASQTNLNDVTAIGWYHCKANATVTTLTNCPTTNAFYMEVKEHAGTWQHIVEYVTSNPKHFDRNYYNNSWSSWREWKLTDNNTTYSAATTSSQGLMSAADKTKLDGVATGAEVNQVAFSNVKVGDTTVAADSKTDTLTLAAGSNVTLTPDATNDKITIASTNTTYSNMGAATSSSAGTAGLVPAPAAGKQTSFLRGDGTWVVPTNTTYSVATTSANGLMSASDKSKLDGVASGAEVNQNAFSNVKVGSVTVAADGKTDTLELVAGSNVTLTGDATNDKVTIAATNTTYSNATTSAAGLMSASDKTALNRAASMTSISAAPTQSDPQPGAVSFSSDVTIGGVTIPGYSKGFYTGGAGDGVLMVTDPSGNLYTVYRNGTTWQNGSKVTKGATTYSDATTSASGLMSSSDKTKLNGIATGAEVNQNAFSNVTVGSTTISADGKTDTLTLAAGSNITLTPDATNDKVTIAATDTNTTYSASSPISLSGTTFSHATSGVTAATYGTNSTTALTPGFGSTFSVPGFAVNATGHVTSASSHTVKMPNATATTSAAGLMSTSDKTWVNAYATPDTSKLGPALRLVKVGNLAWITVPTSNIQALNTDLKSASGSNMTLPSGYRPKYELWSPCVWSNGDSSYKLGTMRITTAGAITFYLYSSYGGGMVTISSSNYTSYTSYILVIDTNYVIG